jgi:serine/threonine protein kinase
MSAERHTRRRIGRYELQALIGEGGMGNVYRGLDTKTGRAVAIKVVNVPGDEDVAAKLRLRFMREVLAVSRIGHPNVVRVDDYGFDDDNTPYLVMELLNGTDLGKVLRSSRSPLPIPYVVDMALEVCAAVRACHAAQITHRDLKPGNIFLAKTDAGPGWQVKVLDFGVAKSPVFEGNLTNLGQIVGTLQYVSPEQVNGVAGPESDQYGIGVILYACLTKRLPFGGLKDIALLKAISRGEFLPPRTHRSDLPDALERIVLRAMSVSPADRFESVYALGQELWPLASRLGRRSWERFYAAEPVSADNETTTEVRSPARVVPGETGPVSGPTDDATVVALYDATTVVGVDNTALIASVPTQVLTGPTDYGQTLLAEESGQAPISDRSAGPGTPSSARSTGVRWRMLVAAVVLAILFVALGGLLRLRGREVGDASRDRAPSSAQLARNAVHVDRTPEPSEVSSALPAQTEAPLSADPPNLPPKRQHRSAVHRGSRRVSGHSPDQSAVGPERDANGVPILP